MEKIFSNYDLSFHNELWASAFFGNFAVGTTWHWERVFWWPGSLVAPPPDGGPFGNQWQPGQVFSNVSGATNVLDIGIPGGYSVINKPVHHNFKPLADLLANPDWQAYDFFSGNFDAHRVYNDAGRLECYYLLNTDGNLAIGWVHNLNAYWNNQFYVTRAVQDFLGCNDPNAQAIGLPGFIQGMNFHVTYFPTRMDTTALPDDQVDSTGTGVVTLNFSSEQMNGVVNNYLDTLHSDYAFIIAPQPVVRSMTYMNEADTLGLTAGWDFSMYPNPASDAVTLMLPPDGAPRDVAVFDLTGKRVYFRGHVTAPTLGILTGSFAKGAYCVRVSDAKCSKMRTLIMN